MGMLAAQSQSMYLWRTFDTWQHGVAHGLAPTSRQKNLNDDNDPGYADSSPSDLRRKPGRPHRAEGQANVMPVWPNRIQLEILANYGRNPLRVDRDDAVTCDVVTIPRVVG